MKLNDGMLLYHGSYTPVEVIDLKQCAPGKDFGQGFYLTSDLNQARNFISSVLNGLYGDIQTEEAVKEAIRRLIPDHLVDQYCFLTEGAISCLEFKEARKQYVRA